MESLVVSLAVAAATAITWLAYKHPEGYRLLFFALMIIVAGFTGWVIAELTGGIWGVSFLKLMVDDHPEYSLSTVAKDIRGAYAHFGRFEILVMWDALVASYLVFLRYLPRMLGPSR